MQLQFVDEWDMFFVPEKARARVSGGVRTTVTEAEIRCDNVQHGLEAAYAIIDSFEHLDFRIW
jgi:hypothetical protein